MIIAVVIIQNTAAAMRCVIRLVGFVKYFIEFPHPADMEKLFRSRLMIGCPSANFFMVLPIYRPIPAVS